MTEAGTTIVTVARDGSRCANFKRGGVHFSFPIWTVAAYVARARQRDGVVTWRRMKVPFYSDKVSGREPPESLLKAAMVKAEDWGFGFVTPRTVRHGMPVSDNIRENA